MKALLRHLLCLPIALLLGGPAAAEDLPVAGAPAAEAPAERAAVEGLPAEALALPLADVRAAADAAPATLSAWRGARGLLVIFLSNTCPYVLDWADRLPRLAAQARELGIGLAVVNSNGHTRKRDDSPEEMRRFAAAHLGGLPYLLDEDARLADLLKAERTPEVFLFGGQLELFYRGPFDDLSGPIEKVGEHYLRDAMTSLAQGGPPPPARPALGCAIQRPRRRPSPSEGG